MLFSLNGIEPAVGKTSSALWRKHKQTGIITGFSRGKKLSDYRATIIQKNEDLLIKSNESQFLILDTPRKIV
jgi:hypothetical protein